MAFKQSNNPISRKTSPLRAGGFTMDQLDKTTTSEQLKSQEDAKTLTSKDDLKRFPGDDEGRLEHKISPEEYNDQYTAPSRKASPLNDESKGNMKKTLVDKPSKPVPPVLPKATNESPKPAIERAPNKPYKKPPSRKTHKK